MRLKRTKFNSVLYSTQCYIQPSAVFNPVLYSTQCCIQPSAIFNPVLYSTQCYIQPSAIFNLVLYSNQCCIQPSAIFNLVLYSNQCCIQPSAIFTQPYVPTVWYIHSSRIISKNQHLFTSDCQMLTELPADTARLLTMDISLIGARMGNHSL